MTDEDIVQSDDEGFISKQDDMMHFIVNDGLRGIDGWQHWTVAYVATLPDWLRPHATAVLTTMFTQLEGQMHAVHDIVHHLSEITNKTKP